MKASLKYLHTTTVSQHIYLPYPEPISLFKKGFTTSPTDMDHVGKRKGNVEKYKKTQNKQNWASLQDWLYHNSNLLRKMFLTLACHGCVG